MRGSDCFVEGNFKLCGGPLTQPYLLWRDESHLIHPHPDAFRQHIALLCLIIVHCHAPAPRAPRWAPFLLGVGQLLRSEQPLQPSEDLAAVVGAGTMARGEVVSKVWVYIKANKLQNPDDGREIIADDKLRKVFGKDKVTMFEMNKFLAQHLK